MRSQADTGMYACPCCGYATLEEVAGFEICELCCWEDDGQDDPDQDEDRGGPNRGSLSQARRAYLEFVASDAVDDSRRRPGPSDVRLRRFVAQGQSVGETS